MGGALDGKTLLVSASQVHGREQSGPGRNSNRPSAQNEVQNEGDNRKNQKQMDQSAGHMKDSESAKPRDQ
jgi:hypothetical protein